MDVETCRGFIGGDSVKDLIDSNATSGSGSGVPLLVRKLFNLNSLVASEIFY